MQAFSNVRIRQQKARSSGLFCCFAYASVFSRRPAAKIFLGINHGIRQQFEKFADADTKDFAVALTDTMIKALKAQDKQRKVTDGGGLYLLVKPNGSKLWNMAFSFDGKQGVLSFGAYPHVSLSDARKKRDDAKRLLAKAINPAHQAKLDKIARKVANAETFEAIADEFVEKVKREGKADATLVKKVWLLGMAKNDFGKRPISDITAPEILICLRKVEGAGNYETARRLRSTIGQVFRFAIATARADTDPTFGLRGALTAPTVTHRPAITERKAFGGLLRAIWGYDGSAETKAALMLMAYLYPRPGELRQAEWQEFDLENAMWIIPTSRTKMRREHRKPLSKQAIAILTDLHKLTGDGRLTFPSIKSRLRPISENTMNGALRRMGFTAEEVTSHGFRATASTLLNESGKWSSDAIEAELAHIGADQVRKAYHRALYWDERVLMAQSWADEIDLARITL